jgi:hypothetical protein
MRAFMWFVVAVLALLTQVFAHDIWSLVILVIAVLLFAVFANEEANSADRGTAWKYVSYIVVLCGIFGTVVLLGGCAVAPNTVRVETAHYSHLTAGWPTERQQGSEDGLSVLSLVGRWDLPNGLFVELSEGVNLEGRNGGGFYGPAEVTGIKVGMEFRVKQPSFRGIQGSGVKE